MTISADVVNRALERAHNASMRGSDAARSGTISDEAKYVRALLVKAQEATQSMANWEAINTQLADAGVRAAVNWLELGAVGAIRVALIRDALLGTFTLSDQIQKSQKVRDGNTKDESTERVTLCRVAEWLSEPAVLTPDAIRSRVIDSGLSERAVESEIARTYQRIYRLKGDVPIEWNETSQKSALGKLRVSLRPARNRLAHTLQGADLQGPTVDEIRKFISLTLDLATDAAIVWLGSVVPANDYRAFALSQATKFWPKAFVEPVRIWRKDMQQRQRAAAEID